MTQNDGNNQLPFGKYYVSMALETVCFKSEAMDCKS